MKYSRGILSGFIVWLCVSISFYLLDNILLLKDYFLIQAAIVMVLIVFYAIVGAKFYYQKKYNIDGFALGVLMSGTALFLDVLITVPFVEIPEGRSYESFFTSPILWALATINVFSVYIYWKRKIKP
ncbi:DUF5367 domain-containing protein [Flavobacterium collinsii]|uniref:Uncharacterized protein n=1 Tax=Flavobacterium collinsii TaxID=1114861 RepID=A0A9W4X565_9FLAO|nr:DUF5367 domain-containing protein [Flavobacterium collinsii]CAI2769204.1 conserved membrane protein of unknown function [Flavobacterium collinsii]